MVDAQVRNQGYRGRVRSGCLTCRRRKVKCDEAKPACDNCNRLQRQCVYKPRRNLATSVEVVGTANPTVDIRGLPAGRVSHHQLPSPSIPSSEGLSIASAALVPSPATSQGSSPVSSPGFAHTSAPQADRTDSILPLDLLLRPDVSLSVDVTARLRKVLWEGISAAPFAADNNSDDGQVEHGSPATFISRDIQLTTTMDLLTARREDTQLTAFFVDQVDCPGITPFDDVNWHRAKRCFAALGRCCPAVALGITAVALLCKATLYTLPLSRAVAHYDSARRALESLVSEERNFDAVLVVVFLLCLFNLIHAEEAAPALKTPSKTLLDRLEAWAAAQPLHPRQNARHPHLSTRLVVWLKILQAMTMRGGGNGLLDASVCRLLPDYEGPIPNIADHTCPTDGPADGPATPTPDMTPSAAPPSAQDNDQSCPDLGSHLYEVLSAPVFDFYLQLQRLSGEVTTFTHYHRSRATAADQDEVVARVARTKDRLHALWAGRPAVLRQTPETLRAQLTPVVVRRLAGLAGVCKAAFYAEFVELDRVLGDPVTRWTDASRTALAAIREIVDGDRLAQHRSGSIPGEDTSGGMASVSRQLNPGYIRPLFMYAIECMDEEQNQWAVDRLADIQNPIYRSAFFSAFAKALSDAQIAKDRRVTSRYFCVWYFGVPPPYL